MDDFTEPMTLDEFCTEYKIGYSTFFTRQKLGRAPETAKHGRHVIIYPAARRDWLKREQEERARVLEQRRVQAEAAAETSGNPTPVEPASNHAQETAPPKRRRGRPPKIKAQATVAA
jgi:hypothetical protein